MYLHNAWYVAAVSGEIGRKLTPLTILAEDIVIYRTRSGAPIALENACPHRKLPLSMGKIKGDNVECGYHGLTFDWSGLCVDAATQSKIPPAARVRSYPVTDRWGLTWIWMGKPDLADPAKIIRIDHFDDPNWKITEGDALTCRCHYLYLIDNLLDPSHVAWVHPTTFAAGGTQDTKLETKEFDYGLVVSRWIYGQYPPPFYASLLPFPGKCDRLQHYEVRYPSTAINKSVYVPAGCGGPDRSFHSGSYIMTSYHFLTPIDDDSTRYHWLQHRNTQPRDDEITRKVAEGARSAFREDKAILEAVHLGMKRRETPNLNLALDAGSIRFRRRLEQLIVAE